ncbi:MAG: Ldh family oxidoreductase [Reichenbachiella sp.]
MMKETKLVDHNALLNWAKACLMKVGVSDKDAQFVAYSLVQTSLWGIDSHGIARLPHYLSRIEAGSLNPEPNLKIENTGPCSSNLDADDALGIVAMGAATNEAINLAEKNGIGVVGVRESSHCGAIGIYGRMIAEKGLVGIVFTHSDAFVAPHNGYKKFLGTNPICISAPNADGKPMCLDMATSAIPFNYIMNARNENQKIPNDVAYNDKGETTEDPHAVASLRPMAEHKGYALALMIDLLCGPLNGMPWGPNIGDMYGDLTEKRHLGSLVIALDPTRFFGGLDLSQVVASMAKSARVQIASDPKQPVLVPGDDQYTKEEVRSKSGIPVESGLNAQIEEWCEKLDVAMPELVTKVND